MNHTTEQGSERYSLNERIVPFAKPSIGEAERQAVLEVLDSGWLTTGAQAAAFEQEFAEAVGAKHALAVSSATAGLHLALEAAHVKPGDGVAVSPYTFASSAEVIRYLGAEPVFIDIEENSPNISPEALERALSTPGRAVPADAGDRPGGGRSVPAESPAESAASCGEPATPGHPSGANRRISAVIPVHIAGLPCRMPEIRDIAARHQLKVIEDAAHAFPARLADGSIVGSQGTAVFSFYANKTITTGEGGMVATDSPELASRIRLMRLHGIDRTVWDRYRRPGAAWEYDLVAPGYKYNLPDILATIGRRQLERSPELHARRAAIAGQYLQMLESVPEVELPPSASGHAWHLFSIQVDADIRDAVIDDLGARGVGTSVHYKPLHLMTYYRHRYSLNPEDFPRATARYRRSISLPLYPDMDSEDTRYVVESLKQVLFGRSAARVR